jgi:hypothetical protein
VDNKPTPGEITILAAGVVGLIASFLDFYGIGDAGSSVWSSGLFPVATLMVIFVIVMAVHVALTRFASVNLPDQVAGFSWVQIHLALGFFATLYALAYLVVKTGGVDRKIGFWLILAACIAALVGAILISKERVGGGTPPTAPPTA